MPRGIALDWIAEWPRLQVPADSARRPSCSTLAGFAPSPSSANPSPRPAPAAPWTATGAPGLRRRPTHPTRVSDRAAHRRGGTEVLAREQELVAGYAELTYSGFLTITAFDPDALETQAGEWQQVAAQAGLELRPLHGQHVLALATALPLGTSLPRRRSILT